MFAWGNLKAAVPAIAVLLPFQVIEEIIIDTDVGPRKVVRAGSGEATAINQSKRGDSKIDVGISVVLLAPVKEHCSEKEK